MLVFIRESVLIFSEAKGLIRSHDKYDRCVRYCATRVVKDTNYGERVQHL